jgi:hypothetical protein
VDEETHLYDALVEADTYRPELFYLWNLKLDSDGFVLLAFQRLAVFLHQQVQLFTILTSAPIL